MLDRCSQVLRVGVDPDRIRFGDELESIPVVVITAWSHAEIDAQVAGADRFVSKPFDPDDLSVAVKELLT